MNAAANASFFPLQYCILVGDVINGFRILGPFESLTLARDWAKEHGLPETAAMTLYPAPEQFEIGPELARFFPRKVA